MGGVQSAHIYAAVPIDMSQGRPSCDGPAPRGAYLQASTREPLLPPARVLPVTAMGQYSDSVCVCNMYRFAKWLSRASFDSKLNSEL